MPSRDVIALTDTTDIKMTVLDAIISRFPMYWDRKAERKHGTDGFRGGAAFRFDDVERVIKIRLRRR